jgi:D-glycero-D-manno-heptose 1,7-bisphosphate phosphatase
VRAAAFLDRDGVLNELVPDPATGLPESPLRVEEVRLIAGAAAAAARLSRAGFVLVCVSNQPAAAKGKVSVQQLRAVHQRVVELLGLAGVRLACSRLCLHHPDGVQPTLSRVCGCRKPAPGMLLDAARALALDLGSSWMFGDTDADMLAASSAGCRGVLIEYPGSAPKRCGQRTFDVPVADLGDGVERVLSRRRFP